MGAMFGGRAAAVAFETAVALRNRAYDRNWLPVHRVPVPVVSVGNLAVGGQGKTPFTIWLCHHLEARGVTVGVLSRGYGRRSLGCIVVSRGDGPLVSARTGGDEPVLIAARTQAIVIADRDRVRAARRAVELGADLLILDDGHQHRRLHRDLNLVVVGDRLGGQLLPAGRLREPVSMGLARAHGLVWVEGAERIRVRGPFQVQVAVEVRPPRALFGTVTGLAVQGRRVGLAAGIARPERLQRAVTGLGAQVVARCFVPDHGSLSSKDLERFGRALRDAGATGWITTEKDEVKLTPRVAARVGQPGWVLPIQHRVVEGEAELAERLKSLWASR